VEQPEHGLRSLFVALTRCTSRLALVHARPLPSQLGLGAPEPTASTHGMVAGPEPSGPESEAGEPEPEPADREAETAAQVAEPEPVEVGPAQPEPVERKPVERELVEREPAEPEPVEREPARPEPEPADREPVDREPARPEPVEPEPAAPLFGVAPAAGQAPPEHPGQDVDVAGRAEPDPAAHGGLAEQVVVSTPGTEADHVLDALGDLDRDIARAIARTVAAKLAHLLSPPLLALVADELSRELQAARDVGHAAGPGDDDPPGEPPGAATNGAARAGEADVAPASEVPAP
jgi:hypothetical protein